VQAWLIFIDSLMLGSCARLTFSLASCARLQSLQSPLLRFWKNDNFFPQLSQKLAISHLILVEPINMCCELWADQSVRNHVDSTARFSGGCVKETADRFVSGESRAEENSKDDRDAGEVFNLPITVGEPRTWLPRAHAKRDPQGDCRQGVAGFVDGVGKQCDTPRVVGDNGLQERCQQEAD
jgi:hypothetical protein